MTSANTTSANIKTSANTKPSRSEITEREIAEIEAQMYADAKHNIQIGIYIWQLEDSSSDSSSDDDSSSDSGTLRLISTNSAARRFTGVDAKGLIGQTISEIFPALAATDIPAIYKQVARTGEGRNLGEIAYGDDRVEQGVFSV